MIRDLAPWAAIAALLAILIYCLMLPHEPQAHAVWGHTQWDDK